MRRKFSPEFVNRIDGVITYQPLSAKALAIIVDQQIEALQNHIANRLMERAFEDRAVRRQCKLWAFLLRKGTSDEYGGSRELKRIILRYLTQPLAAMVIGKARSCRRMWCLWMRRKTGWNAEGGSE